MQSQCKRKLEQRSWAVLSFRRGSPAEIILREKLRKCLAGQIKHGSESPGDSGRAPDTSDSQANRVDRIYVGYVDERARSKDTPNYEGEWDDGSCIRLVARAMSSMARQNFRIAVAPISVVVCTEAPTANCFFSLLDDGNVTPSPARSTPG